MFRYFFASSACVYPLRAQSSLPAVPLSEDLAYPADPEDGYGWEKLFSERMCRHYFEDYGLETRVARFHNIYGTWGAWQGGREKAPAALCRKVSEALIRGRREIAVWGDGCQQRSFLHVDDCIEGILRLTSSSCRRPLNIGSEEAYSIDELVSHLEGIRRDST